MSFHSIERGRTLIHQAFVLVVLLSLVACSWSKQCTKTSSYNIGEEKIVTVGSEMVQAGCFAARWEPSGWLNKILWGDKVIKDEDFQALIDKELLYAGREGDILHISYREYFRFRDYKTGLLSSYAREPYFQQVFYDLKTSNTVVFQDWVIQVLDANNHQVRFKVLIEPRQPETLMPRSN